MSRFSLDSSLPRTLPLSIQRSLMSLPKSISRFHGSLVMSHTLKDLNPHSIRRSLMTLPESTSRFRGSLLMSHELKYYNPQLDCGEAYKTMNEKKLLWNAIEMDAALENITPENYLLKCENKINEFVTKGELYGQKDIINTLNEVVRTSGSIAYLAGGTSAGKTTILNSVVSNVAGGTTICLDGRIIGTNIEHAILSELNLNNPSLFDMCIRGILPALMFPLFPGDKQTQLLNLMKIHSPILPIFFQNLAKICPPLTIIFDNAEIIFNQENKHVLQVLIELTRARQMNIVFTSSEYNFPLIFGGLKMNISKYLIIKDLPPLEIWNLLSNEWKIGPNLSAGLINHFGGHVKFIILAMKQLKKNQNIYHPWMTYDPLIYSVNNCIFRALDHPNIKDRIYPYLKSLSQEGYIELKQQDILAEHLSKHCIGGFVPYEAISPPISQIHYNRRVFIPSFQIIRMVIAAILAEGEKV